MPENILSSIDAKGGALVGSQCVCFFRRKSFGEELDFASHKTLGSVDQYKKSLKEMFRYNEQLFIDYPKLSLEEQSKSLSKEIDKLKASITSSSDNKEIYEKEEVIKQLESYNRAVNLFIK